MGLAPSAYLIWGIPVVSHDENGDPTPHWDEEREDWRKLDSSRLKYHQFGHYEDPDCQRAILTSQHVRPYSGDAWDPTEVSDLTVSDKTRSKANDDALYNKLGVSFYEGEAKWYLVASYG